MAASKNTGNRKTNQMSEQESSAGSSRIIKNLLDGSFLAKDASVRFLPFLLFVTLLGLIYIANIYYAEETMRDMDDLNKELKELRFEYVATHTKLMNMSKQSEVAKKLKPIGLKESTTPPYKIQKKKSN